MLLTWKQNLKHLSYEEYHYLRRISSLSRAVYNSAIYNIRKHYEEHGEFLEYRANWPLLKDSDNYLTLGGGPGKAAIQDADYAFKSFFALLRLQRQGKYESYKIQMPRYESKNGFHSLTFTEPIKFIHDGKFQIPVSRVIRKEGIKTRIYLNVPEYLLDKNIHQIRVVPKHNGKMFEVRYIYEIPDPKVDESKLDFSKALAIDLGVTNFATCVTSDGDSFIVDGRKIKSINQWYNKEMARLSKINKKQHRDDRSWTNLQYLKTYKRKRQIDDIVYCSAKRIIQYCLNHKIGHLIVGYNSGFQESPRIGRKNNQNFCMMPFGQLKNRLEFLCKIHGIKYKIQEESYTSKASFWDNDPLPAWDGKHHEYTFSGKRGYKNRRGDYYRKTTGTTLNSDLNGALNILRKSNVVDLSILYARGDVITPRRIRSA